MPASYLAQERPDPVVRGYLDSLGVRTIALESWNAMPLLLKAINPAYAAQSIRHCQKARQF
jgi:hypothetical protein